MANSEQGAAYAANRLGVEPVGKLLLRFSIPAITGMLVNALYNVVDRVFVGQGVGEIALGGLSLVMPLMTISMAFAMLFGIGAANMMSMRLGQERRADAENALNHCFWLLLGVGLLIMALSLAFIKPILSMTGAQEGSAALPYAEEYYRVILYGQVFMTIGFGLSHCTRAQGFPTITMASMLIGALMNVALDPLFIFVFGWGVAGAAWATIISQFASFVWLVAFCLGKKTVVRLNLRSLKPSAGIVRQIASFGAAPFLLQIAASAVMFLYNNSMKWYGASGLGIANGGDVALSGMNIVSSVSMVILMPVFGVNQGAQPILGFNYGAKKFSRVLSAYRMAVIAAVAVCAAGFVVTELYPDALVGLFAPEGSDALVTFAPLAMRVGMLMLPLNGFQIVSSNMFVVTGRPKMSILLSTLRQVILLIPLLLLFGRIWGLIGVVAAAPVADGLSALVTGVIIFFELRSMRRLSDAPPDGTRQPSIADAVNVADVTDVTA